MIRLTLLLLLASCTTAPRQQPQGDVYSGDPCLALAYTACHQGNVHAFDACGSPGPLEIECSNVLCANAACQPASCNDGLRNGRESDVDCGGGTCPACGPGETCLTPEDCDSGSCSGVCLAATCSDSILNQTESDTDCGGCCAPCDDWSDCRDALDCLSGNCSLGRCLPGNCSDGVKNGSESDVDCGGSCQECTEGSICNGPNDCQSRECTGVCGPFVCPSGMFRVGQVAACVDPYEAVIDDRTDCAGTQYGQGANDDLPAGFPDLVESRDCSDTCMGRLMVAPTVALFACSAAGRRPSGHVTWFQAKRACENVSKKLCRWPTEWLGCCRGDPPTAFPYGDTYTAATCNDGFAGAGGSVATGSMSGCHGAGFAADVFDASGNLWEWTETCTSDDACRSAGGSWAEVGDSLLACTTGHIARAPDYSGDTVGFRCCWTP